MICVKRGECDATWKLKELKSALIESLPRRILYIAGIAIVLI